MSGNIGNKGNMGGNVPSNPMTPSDASRIQSANAKSGQDMGSGGFAARAQGAGARNENSGSAGNKK
ncbi:hypothetical protein K490DRAFT_67099 [Saccharata proteae CBS 121410]|uniref:SMP domain-containing protein n=1 Tax=Saccharata proteae CBS 121410 TaxID=1314787 RepID=A0A9P4HT02_9PEZI|nr:hypothetical protein K490DRAFT_67099 [Saccharata proteae CBS 121410]